MTYARAEQLTSQEAGFYQAILRQFPERGGPPDAAWLAAEAESHGLDAEAALARLAEHDLLVRDDAGAIVSMYPFSGVPTPHRVTVAGGTPVYSMCAIDALGIPFMLGTDAVTESVDPTTDTPIRVAVRGGRAQWEPATAAFLTASIDTAQGPKAQTCCQVMNFFAAAEAYRANNPGLDGRVLSQEEALERGKRYFGGLLSPEGQEGAWQTMPDGRELGGGNLGTAAALLTLLHLVCCGAPVLIPAALSAGLTLDRVWGPHHTSPLPASSSGLCDLSRTRAGTDGPARRAMPMRAGGEGTTRTSGPGCADQERCQRPLEVS